MALPRDALLTVFSAVPLSDRVRACELVSKSMHSVLQEQPLCSVLDLSMDPVFRNQVTMQLLQRLIERSMLAQRHSVQASPIQQVVLRDCQAQGALPAQMLQQLLLRCPSVREVDARGFGACHFVVNQRGYMHFNDLLALLRTFNMNRHLMQQVKAIHVDVLCWCLGDSWQSSAYQRAIGCDSLWLTLMRMLEPDSIFKIGRIAFSAGIPSSDQLSISPSEMRKAVLARIAHIEKHITHHSTVECIDMLPGSKLESSLLEQPDVCKWAGVPPCRLWTTSRKAAPGYQQLN